jgi:hypothetical protein
MWLVSELWSIQLSLSPKRVGNDRSADVEDWPDIDVISGKNPAKVNHGVKVGRVKDIKTANVLSGFGKGSVGDSHFTTACAQRGSHLTLGDGLPSDDSNSAPFSARSAERSKLGHVKFLLLRRKLIPGRHFAVPSQQNKIFHDGTPYDTANDYRQHIDVAKRRPNSTGIPKFFVKLTNRPPDSQR